MSIVFIFAGDFNRSKGKEIMEAFLKSEGKNINALYAHNDDMAIGVIQAIEEYGLKPGKNIIIVSIDAVEGLMAGKTLPKWIKSKEDVFPPQEVAEKVLPTRKY